MNNTSTERYNPVEAFLLWLSDIIQALTEDCSDRTLVILAASALDEILEKILKAFFIEMNKNMEASLFEGTGALNPFSAKIKLCYALGLISKLEYNQLAIIRKIRNEFAHTTRPVVFAEKAITQSCKRLQRLKDLGIAKPMLAAADSKAAKAYFKDTTLALLNGLSHRYIVANTKRCQPAIDIDYRESISANMSNI